MRIAVFDYIVTPNNAVGNCDRIMLEGLCQDHDFTVFAVEFDNPNPNRIQFVRIPAPKHPLFLMYIVFFVLSPIYLFLYQRRLGRKFDLIQSIESITPCGNIIYSHFCHRAYLRDHWKATMPSGLPRRYARWLSHKLFSLTEPLIYSRAQKVIVPSQGLHRELCSIYGKSLSQKEIQVISNPINRSRMQQDQTFDARSFRHDLGLADNDLVLVFVALGHFERKGLPVLLEGIAQSQCPEIKLIVVGGSPSVIESYRERAHSLGIAEQVKFVGLQKDVRPYLWAADIFTLPSSYEVFPLVSLEAAAAGLPLLTTAIYGVEEFLIDDVNGWCVEQNANAIAERLRSITQDRSRLKQMGWAAAKSVMNYSAEAFVENWRRFLMSV